MVIIFQKTFHGHQIYLKLVLQGQEDEFRGVVYFI